MRHFIVKLRTILLYNFLYYILLCITVFYLIIYIGSYIPHYNYKIDETNFDLIITSYNIDYDKLSLELKGKDKLSGIYYFKDQDEANTFKMDYELGTLVNIKGSLKLPNNNTIPNTFNYKKHLLYKDIKYIINIEEITKIKDNKNILLRLKNYVINRIENISNNEYLYAFILGNSKYLSTEVSNNYKINTITHLFALSGLHVSIFASLLSKILKKFNEKLSLIIITLFLLLLCFITSFTPSIVRATIFYILLSLNKIYYTYITSKNLLFVTFSIMIFINPFYIYNLGFVLSFTITYFLLLSNENIKINNKLLSLLIMSFIASISSFPIIINNFYKLNIIGFINNLFFVPYVSSIVYPFSLICFLIPFFTPVLNILTNIMEYISFISSSFLNISIVFPKISILGLIIFYSIIILFIKYKKKFLIIILIVLLIFFYNKKQFDKNTMLYFIDVGQGDSILIKSENNKYILIDTGGKEYFYDTSNRNRVFNIMNDSMIPFFNSIGIRKIDYLFITHGDADHMGESLNLINNFDVDNVVFNIGSFNELENLLIEALNKKSINYYQNIESVIIDNNTYYFLNTKDYHNENENSSVIFVNINDNKLLFMGDAGSIKEKDIINKYNLNNIDILKVGHHGSDTSSSMEFINKIRPKTCIISVGKNNKFGHPRESVLNNLSKCKIYRTDINGTITLKLNNNNYSIETTN